MCPEEQVKEYLVDDDDDSHLLPRGRMRMRQSGLPHTYIRTVYDTVGDILHYNENWSLTGGEWRVV